MNQKRSDDQSTLEPPYLRAGHLLPASAVRKKRKYEGSPNLMEDPEYWEELDFVPHWESVGHWSREWFGRDLPLDGLARLY